MVVWPRCSLPSAVVGGGWRGELGTLDATETMLGGCRNTRVARAHGSLGWGAGVIEYEVLVHDESTGSIGGRTCSRLRI
jgi:hypothetical protein